MKIRLGGLAGAALVACVSGCTTTLYRPNQVATPLLREVGELKGTVGSNNLQLAYAPLPHLALMANGYYGSYDQNARTAHGWLAEVGAGTFGSLPVPNLIWEAYGGTSYGQVSLDDTLDANTASPRPVHYDARAVRAFVQPNLGYVTPYFELGAALRLSGVKYVALSTEGYTGAEAHDQFLESSEVTEPVWMFLEPGVTVKAGYKWVKAFYHHTWSLKLGGGDLPYDNQADVIGVSVDLAHWYDRFSF